MRSVKKQFIYASVSVFILIMAFNCFGAEDAAAPKDAKSTELNLADRKSVV